MAKRLEILRELVPAAARVAVLVNPSNAPVMETTLRELMVAARAIGAANPGLQGQHPAARLMRPSQRLCASGPTRCSSAPTLFHQPARAIGQSGDAPGDPDSVSERETAETGGLMSYGANIPNVCVRLASMPAASSKARSRRICRSCSRQSSNWSSTPKPPGCSASTVPPTLLAARRRGDRMMRGASSSRCSAVRRWRGRWRRARSSRRCR